MLGDRAPGSCVERAILGRPVGTVDTQSWGPPSALHRFLDPVLVLAQVGVDARVARQGTALHSPGHEALELSLAHQGSPRVTLRGWDRDRDTDGQIARARDMENPRGTGGQGHRLRHRLAPALRPQPSGGGQFSPSSLGPVSASVPWFSLGPSPS